MGLVGNVGYVCDFDIFWRKMDFELFCTFNNVFSANFFL